jgi:para-aminobenzoate synthetase component 1
MRQMATYHISNIDSFKRQLSCWSAQFEQSAVFEGEASPNYGKHLKYDMLVGADSISQLYFEENSFSALSDFHKDKKDWIFGFLSYDLKNEIEDLKSENDDNLSFPIMHFFQPKWVFEIIQNEVIISFPEGVDRKEMQLLFKDITHFDMPVENKKSVSIKSKISKEQYFEGFEKLKEHIYRGDIYEVNYCQEYYAENVVLNPISVYHNLYDISKPPFAAFYRCKENYLMCASPERFLKKEGSKLISQPIKGTRKRSVVLEEDNRLKDELLNCPKEQSENVMIVDLVRNDLSKTALASSVKVEELFGIYSFPQVHQMISTIVSELDESIHWVDAIRHAFPMGSMTGAPKISAMQLIEKVEVFKRGLYSGAVGYVNPSGDFDFNVVIRSILYNSKKKYATMPVGSAITANANPKDEYEECELKVKAMMEVLDA